jgi:class 3 adenylate cyclase
VTVAGSYTRLGAMLTVRSGIIAALAALLGAALGGTAAFGGLEAMSQDVRLARLSGPAALHDRIAIVAITEATLAAQVCRSPVDRAFLAQLIDRIGADGPAAIGLAVLLDQPSDAAGDAALAAALARHRDRTVVITAPGRQEGAAIAAPFQIEGLAVARGGHRLSRRDKMLRSQRPLGRDGAPESLAGVLAARAGIAPFAGERLVPFATTDPASPQPWPFATYPAHDVAAFAPEAKWFAGKVVLIGAVLDAGDTVATPLRYAAPPIDPLPGVAAHGYELAQLLDQRPGPALGWFGAFVVCLTAGLAGAMLGEAQLRWAVASLAVAAGAAGIVILAMAAFALFGVMTPLAAPTFAFVGASLAALGVSAQSSRDARRQIDRAFRHYLDPRVVDDLMRQPERLDRVADTREITVVFTDLEGFTAMVERAPTAQIGPLLNAYFETLIEVIVRHGGTVDKIVGDAVHAMFGAPVADPDHARRAIQCALELDAAAERYRTIASLAWGRTRIAAHTGPALVGNFGGSRRLDYTAHGAVINLTSRLEGANRAIGTRVLVSRATLDSAAWTTARPIGPVQLRGAAAPFDIFEPLPAARSDAAYATAFEALARGDNAAMRALAAARPDDPLPAFQARRGNVVLLDLAGLV